MNTQSTQADSNQDTTPDANVTHASVVLVLETLDPMIINPHFFSRKGVVPPDRDIDIGETHVGPESSRVVYRNGHAISADRRKLTFEQSGAQARENQAEMARIESHQIDVAHLAIGFLTAADNVYCTAVGINFHAIKRMPGTPPQRWVNTLLHQDGKQICHGDLIPSVEIGAMYQLDDKKMSMTISDATAEFRDSRWPAVLFRANCHRDILGDGSNTQARAALETWEKDLEMFLSLVRKLSFRSET